MTMSWPWWQSRRAEHAAPTARDWIRVRRAIPERHEPAAFLPSGIESYPQARPGVAVQWPARPSWPAER